ncbi:MAG: acetate--CoA ligase [Candidatus Pacebacteria bacterium]|nr:acetate--CoA ligase [Candidatus Paceibacterota bacterium]
MIKKDNLYFPPEKFKKSAWINKKGIYQEAEKDPIKFWEKIAKEAYWKKPWNLAFEHKAPYFKWFLGGQINLAENCLDKNLEKKKDKIALIWEPEPVEEQPRIFTYKELLKEVNKAANALKKLGVKKGDRVGIYLPMIPEVIISMLACARIGAVHTVVFSAFSPQALKVRLQDTEARILITADGYFRRGQIINLKSNADEATKETKVEKVVVVKRTKNEVVWNPEINFWFEDLLKNEKEVCEPEAMDSEDLLFILYTSGSTGKPKGILHTCGGYTVQSKFTGKIIFDLHDNDIIWCTSDAGWITGHTYAIYSPLLNGATTVIFEGAPDWPTPERWAQIIEEHKVTIFYTAPTAIRMFEKYGAEIIKKYKFSTLRLLGSVGEPIDESAWNWYFAEVGKGKCPLVDTWWQTETGGILITSLPGIGPFKPSFTGLPLPGVKIDILDDEGKSCPVNKEGNLVILPPFTPGMLRGVYKNPEKYLETYWAKYGTNTYFTSDGAFRDEGGLVRIVGRVDDVLKVAGHRVSTGELENAAAKHPDIIESAVVGIPDEIKGEVPIIFAVSRKEKPEEELKKGIIDQIKKEIGPIALPKEVYIVEDLPKTRSGKIMRRILKRLFTGEELGDLSTLSNPEIVEKIKGKMQNLNGKNKS